MSALDRSTEQPLDPPTNLAQKIRAIGQAFARYWKVASLLVLLCLLVAGAITALTPRVYQATNTVMVVTGSSNTLGNYVTADSLALSKADSYMQIGNSPEVAHIAASSLDGASVEGVSFSVAPGTSQIRVNGRSHTADGAAKVADAYAKALTQEVDRIESIASQGGNYQGPSDIEGTSDPAESSTENLVQLVPVSSASTPTRPVSPDLRINMLIGLGAGLLLAGLYIVIRSLFDRKVRSAEAVEAATSMAILGTIPTDKRLAVQRELIPTAPGRKDRHGWATAEAFRQLRTNLSFANVDNPPRIVVVTSSVAGEGKSSVAANLAMTIAATGQPTVVVDADLRRPVQTEIFNLPSGAGLTDVLIGAVELEDVLQDGPQGSNVKLLASGRTPPNPSELLGSHAMSTLLDHLAKDYMVIIDSPPALPVTDPSVLSKTADGVVMVTHANRTNLDELTKAANRLRTVNATMLGAIVNQVPRRGSGASEYGYYADQYYYSSNGGKKRKKKSKSAQRAKAANATGPWAQNPQGV